MKIENKYRNIRVIVSYRMQYIAPRQHNQQQYTLI